MDDTTSDLNFASNNGIFIASHTTTTNINKII
jgi:hypothetical protein